MTFSATFLSSSPGALEFYCVIGLCAGIYVFFHGFHLLQRRHLILDTPFSKIRSASMGMVEVSGLAAGPYTMVSPITERPCYYYRTLVWEWKRQGKSSQWVKVAAECTHLPFFLDDNTGRILVDPSGAELDIHCDFREEFSDEFFTTKDPAPSSVRSFLARHGVDTDSEIKVEEYCIKPKNSLFILGTLAENPGLEVSRQPIYENESLSRTPVSAFLSFTGASLPISAERESNLDVMLMNQPLGAEPSAHTSHVISQVIRLSPETGLAKSTDMTQQQKISAALIKAGISNPAAWAAAGLVAPSLQVTADPAYAADKVSGGNGNSPSSSRTNPSNGLGTAPSNGGGNGAGTARAATQTTTPNSAAATPNGFDPHPPVVLMKGSNNPAFMISWRSQQDVAGSLRWKSILMIWGGPALALFSLYTILNLLHLL